MAYDVKWMPLKPLQCMVEAQEKSMNYIGPDYSPSEPIEYAYRFVDCSYSATNDPYDDGAGYYSYTQVELKAFVVKKHTKEGFVIYDFKGGGCRNWRFIGNNFNKTFACLTIEEAMTSYIARKQRQASIYKARAAKAEKCIEMLGQLDYILGPSSEPKVT